MNKKSLSYFFYKLYQALISPVFFITAILFNIFVFWYFFYAKQFFLGLSTSDIKHFFYSIPYASIFVIIILSLNAERKVFNNLLPFSELNKIVSSFCSLLVQYILISLPLLLIVPCINLFEDVEYARFCVCFFLIILYAASCISITLFFLYLSSNKNISIIFSVLILILINLLPLFAGIYNNSVLSSFSQVISFSWHFNSAAKGIIDSRDVIYFCVFITLFVYLSFFAQEKKKGYILTKQERVEHYLFLLVLLFIYLNSNHYYIKKDISKDKRFSVSSYTKNLCKNVQNPVYITYYRTKTLSSLYPEIKDIEDYLYEFCSVNNFVLNIKEPEKNNENEILLDYGIYPRQIQNVSKSKTEYISVYSTILVEYEEKWSLLPFILSSNSLEYDLDNLLLKLIFNKQRVVNILCANSLNLKNDYCYVIPWLNSQSIIVNELTIKDNIVDSLKYNDILVIFGCSDIDEKICAQIEEFYDKGGKIISFTSPFDVDIENTWYVQYVKNNSFIEWLNKKGFYFENSLVSDLSCARITMQSEQDENGNYSDSYYTEQINYPLWINVMPQSYLKHGCVMFWSSPLYSTKDDIEPFIFSSKSSWLQHMDRKTAETENLFITNPFALKEVEIPKEREMYTLGLKDKNNSILLISDQYFTNSLMLGYIGGANGDYRNLDVLTNLILRVNGEEELCALHEKSSLSDVNRFYKLYDEKEALSARKRTLFSCFILNPLIIICFGIFIFVKRKKNFGVL